MPKAVSRGYADINEKVIAVFRANGGKVSGWFEKEAILLLHHRGAKTGTERITPLSCRKADDAYVVFASFAGARHHPQWFRNLLAHPDATIEVGTETIRVRARVAGQGERERIWARQKEDRPKFAGFEEKAAPREIPVIFLEPVQARSAGSG